MNPLALALALMALALALQFVSRAFGLSRSARRGFTLVTRFWRLAGDTVERRVERVLPGRGERARLVATPALVAAAVAGWLFGGWPGALGTSACVIVLAVIVEGALERRQACALARQIPELCERIAAAMRAGRSLRASIARATEESSGPGARELALIQRDLDLGERLEVALGDACERTGSSELGALSATVEVQQRAGGSLAVALEELASRLRDEERVRADVRTATAQARASAWLVAGLPVAGGVAFELAAPGSATTLLAHPLGVAVTLVSTAMYAVGLVAISRLARVRR